MSRSLELILGFTTPGRYFIILTICGIVGIALAIIFTLKELKKRKER